MTQSDLPESAVRASKRKRPQHVGEQTERRKRQAAEARAVVAEAQVVKLTADFQAMRKSAIDQEHIAKSAINARAKAREDGFKLGRVAERAGVKQEITAADIEAWPEVSRIKMRDRAENPSVPAPRLGAGTGALQRLLGEGA